MATETNAYEYAPLPGENFIRILTIFPSTDIDSAIESTIETANLDTAEYSALSYTWAMQNGDKSFSRTMRIDGKMKPITQNLYEGLRRIRMETEPLRIWIDAVCINQVDKQEQSSQVARMADIYRKAGRVLVWLGEGETDAANAAVYDVIERTAVHARRRKECGLDFRMDRSCSMCCLFDMGWQCRCTFEEAEIPGLSASAKREFRATQKLLQQTHSQSDKHSRFGVHKLAQLVRSRIFSRRDISPVALDRGPEFSPVALDLGQDVSEWLEAWFKSELFLSKVLQLAQFVATFFDRRYWSRRWVVQEVLVAKELQCHWARFQVNLDDERFQYFLTLMWWELRPCLDYLQAYWEPAAILSYSASESARSLTSCNHINGLLRPRGRLRSRQLVLGVRRTEYDMLEMLWRAKGSMCDDPRDLVYALLGLCETTIVPDYSLNVAQVFAQATQFLIEAGCLNAVLANLWRGPHSVRNDDETTFVSELPSWVVDFRRHSLSSQLSTNFQQDITFVGHSILQCRARVLGTVEGRIDHSQNIFWLQHNRNDCVRRSGAIQTSASSPPPEAQMCRAHECDQLLEDMASGDVVCSINRVGRMMEQYLLVLRPVQDLSSTYTIVGTIKANKLAVDKMALDKMIPGSTPGWTFSITEDILGSVEADIRIT